MSLQNYDSNTTPPFAMSSASNKPAGGTLFTPPSSAATPKSTRSLQFELTHPHLAALGKIQADIEHALVHPVELTGSTLSLGQVLATARHGSAVNMDLRMAPAVEAAVSFLTREIENGKAVYGINTGFGGSAFTRTGQTERLQTALLQMQHVGVLPTDRDNHTQDDTLPVTTPEGNIMPESWVRAGMIIRINSLLRGESGIRWVVMEQITSFMNKNICPVVPLRGSISASGDLSPLSYVAGALKGHAGIQAWIGPPGQRTRVPAATALVLNSLMPVSFHAKEVLALINGTTISCGTAVLALHDAHVLALFTQALTALGVEALAGSSESFAPFISAARPHSGQIEASATIFRLLDGSALAQTPTTELLGTTSAAGKLRQDRYPLRTAAQWIGPQLEDLMLASRQLGVECNSTTDNPLLAPEEGSVYHGGNFQASSVTSAMEKTRLALQNLGRLLFAQITEVINAAPDLPPNLAADDPSLSYTMKAVDIACAAYASELGNLAAPVGTHVLSAEDHNQAVNSLALISARRTVEAADVLTMLAANCLYALCQAVDLRHMIGMYQRELKRWVHEVTVKCFGTDSQKCRKLAKELQDVVMDKFSATTKLDAKERFDSIFKDAAKHALWVLLSPEYDLGLSTEAIVVRTEKWKVDLTAFAYGYWNANRQLYFRNPAAAAVALGRTRALYRYVRLDLNIPMHRGLEDAPGEGDGHDHRQAKRETTGHAITRIYESLRSGAMHGVLLNMATSD